MPAPRDSTTPSQVRSLPGLRIEDMGPQDPKNLKSPVRAYMIYRQPGNRHTASTEPSPESVATLEGASIAVLPFANLSGDPGQDHFVDGMVDDLLTALARFKSLVVIARQSSLAYKGRSVDVREVGRELGVRYVLEGSVRSRGILNLSGVHQRAHQPPHRSCAPSRVPDRSRQPRAACVGPPAAQPASASAFVSCSVPGSCSGGL